jgi:hypothetical protein
MLTLEEQEACSIFFDEWIEAMKADAATKKQSMPTNFRKEISEKYAKLWGADYLKYLVFGRGPGKMPPVDAIEAGIKKSGQQGRTKAGKYMSDRSLAWAIAIGIKLRGTLIFQGKKPGLDFLGSMEKNMPNLLRVIARNEAFNIMTNLVKGLK